MADMKSSRKFKSPESPKDNRNLLVVESPTKARTIGRYLGPSYQVVATVGHLRDLPKGKMGVDLKGDFEVDYVIDPEKKKVVAELQVAAAKADLIYLATDPDREGEAISWHVKWILENAKRPIDGEKVSRITFHEITREAVEEALRNAKEIDIDLVNAQQGRRVLDRVVGYSLSPMLWKKVRRGLSAGRVQSVAVRLIVEREREIGEFKKEKYFKVLADLKGEIRTELVKVEGKSIYKTEKLKLFDGVYSFGHSIFTDRQEVEKYIQGLGSKFRVEELNEREVVRSPWPPLTTSKLQQAAARVFGWSGKQTMSLAQRLYEKGLITYHRTDSVYLSPKAIEDFRGFIKQQIGADYVTDKPRVFRNKSKNAQEAHEAIRPTKVVVVEPEGIDSREIKLYQLIWKRAVASQAVGAKMKNTTVLFSNRNGLFRSEGVKLLFEGFLRITGGKTEEQLLPNLRKGDELVGRKMWPEEGETMPPPRYTDASLVASLERQGIGRPSTYAPIISTIQSRQYVEKDEGKFRPTVLGAATNEFLARYFPGIVSLPFTAGMEDDLDRVAKGDLDWKKMMRDFWAKFEVDLKTVEKNSERVKVAVEKTGEKCPECKEGDLVIRLGRFGKFISCSRFPECKYTRQFKEEAGFKCPTCGAGGVVRRTKAGRRFYGCSNYPKCKWAGWKKP